MSEHVFDSPEPLGPRAELGGDRHDPGDRHECVSGRWGRGVARAGGLEPGVAAVGSVLAVLESPSEVGDDRLLERVADLVRLRSLLDGVLAGHVREWDVRCLWASDGSKSPTARLARDANCSRPTAGGLVKLSRALARMPLTAAALVEGTISADHARRLAQACTDERLPRFLELEAQLIADAVRLAGDYQGFSTVVAYFESVTDDSLHDPTDPDDEPPGAKRRRLERDFRVSQVGDGWDLRGTLGTGDGAIVANQLQLIYDQLWEQDWAATRARFGDVATEADLGRTVGQRRADALVEMARRSSAYRVGDQVARPLITVIVDEAEFTGPIRETFNGVVLSRRDVAEWLTLADFERIVFDPKGKPVDVTSPQRFFTGAMRRAVQVRDRRCSHPTCNVDAERCQIDHIVEHSAGGPTNIDNARLLCPRHNRQRPGRGKKPRPAAGVAMAVMEMETAGITEMEATMATSCWERTADRRDGLPGVGLPATGTARAEAARAGTTRAESEIGAVRRTAMGGGPAGSGRTNQARRSGDHGGLGG